MKKLILIFVIVISAILPFAAFGKDCDAITGKFSCDGKPLYIRNAIIDEKLYFKINGSLKVTNELFQEVVPETKDPKTGIIIGSNTMDVKYICQFDDSLTKYEGFNILIPNSNPEEYKFIITMGTEYKMDVFGDLVISKVVVSQNSAGVPVPSDILSTEQCLKDAP